jgi:hypothetical protein
MLTKMNRNVTNLIHCSEFFPKLNLVENYEVNIEEKNIMCIYNMELSFVLSGKILSKNNVTIM